VVVVVRVVGLRESEVQAEERVGVEGDPSVVVGVGQRVLSWMRVGEREPLAVGWVRVGEREPLAVEWMWVRVPTQE